MEALARYIMQGRMQAMILASGFSFLGLIFPPAGIVSLAAVSLVTLRQGAKEGGYVLAVACLIPTLLGVHRIPLLYGLMLSVFISVWLVSVLLRESRHLLLAVETVIVMAALAVLAAYFYQPDLAHIWQTWLEPQLLPMLRQTNPEKPIALIQQVLSVFYHFVATGLLALIFYVAVVLAGLFLGRSWQAKLYHPGGFKQEYLALQGHPKLAFVSLGIMTVSAFFSGLLAEISWNIGLLLFMLYAFLGTIVLHNLLITFKQHSFFVPLLYLSMIIVPYALMPAAAIGLIDTWLNLRNKIPNQTSV